MSGMDADLLAAIEASKISAQAEKQRRTNVPEDESLRLAIEESKKRSGQVNQRANLRQQEEESLRLAIEASKKTALEESNRRAEEDKQLNFALQLSAAMYKASSISRRIRDDNKDQVVQGVVEKEYAVPVVEGKLEVHLCSAEGLPKVDRSTMNPYVVLRVLTVAPAGTLHITLHEGERLLNKQVMGEQDPYVAIFMDKKRRGTSRVHTDGGRDPKWEQKFEVDFTGKERRNQIEFQVMNKNMLSDDTIGYASLDIADLLSPATKKWIRVDRNRNKKAVKSDGRICVSWRFEMSGVPTFKQLKITESKAARNMDRSPNWDQLLSFPDMMSTCYVQATIRDKMSMRKDRILAISNVISVQGNIHQNYFSKGKDCWHELSPSETTKSVCSDCNAGKIKLALRFTTKDSPMGIGPEEVESADGVSEPQESIEHGKAKIIVQRKRF